MFPKNTNIHTDHGTCDMRRSMPHLCDACKLPRDLRLSKSADECRSTSERILTVTGSHVEKSGDILETVQERCCYYQPLIERIENVL